MQMEFSTENAFGEVWCPECQPSASQRILHGPAIALLDGGRWACLLCNEGGYLLRLQRLMEEAGFFWRAA